MNLSKFVLHAWTAVYYYNNRYILWLKRKARRYSNWLLLLTSSYIVARFIVLKSLEPLFSIGVSRRRAREATRTFSHEIAIVAIAKNEGPYLREWIEYHRMVGIHKIYFYDNESEDDTRAILNPYIASGEVEYIRIEGRARQLDAYNDALRRYKDECRYLAFIDLDEYLMPAVPFKPIVEVVSEALSAYGKGAAGLGVNWAVYGSSGFEKKPSGLVTATFLRRGKKEHFASAHIKTIVNPREVSTYISPHYPIYKLGAYSVNETGESRLYVWFCDAPGKYDRIRINHYHTKSKEQYINEKARRGMADKAGNYDMTHFHRYDLNDVEDRSMEAYAPALGKKLGEGGGMDFDIE